jgi:hypothetical protein
MANPTSFLAREQWTLPVPNWSVGTVGSPPQTPELDLVVTAIIAQEDVGTPVTLWVSLENSVVRPGSPLQDDRAEAIGYFQDRLDVTMTLGMPNSNQPVGNFLRTSDGPTTYNGTGSVSSSVTVSVSANISGGFFGGTPTGNVGGGVSSGNTHSFSETLQDFEVVNDSDSKVVRHSYLMSKSNGGAYSQPEDLVPSLSWIQRFSPMQLYRPPLLALNNLPIISQAVWQSTDTNGVKQPHTLYIDVKQHLAWVTAKNDTGNTYPNHLTASGQWTYTLDVPFQKLDVNTI